MRLLWIVAAIVAIIVTVNVAMIVAMIVTRSIGSTSTRARASALSQLPQTPHASPVATPQSQAQGNVTAIYIKGLIQAFDGNYSGALHLYKKALAIDQYDIDTLNGVGRVRSRLHNFTGVIHFF
jgi:hypothetical protein